MAEKILVNIESVSQNGEHTCSILAQFEWISEHRPKYRSLELLLNFEESVNRENDSEDKSEADAEEEEEDEEEGEEEATEVNNDDPPAPNANHRPVHGKQNTELKRHAQRYRELKLRQNHPQQQKRNVDRLTSQNAAKRPRFQ